jgi:voltage-gated potassium channel Kch
VPIFFARRYEMKVATSMNDQSDSSLLLIVGGDALAERVCRELTISSTQQVCVLWALDAKRQAAFHMLGATTTPLDLASDSDKSLLAAGVMRASSLLVLADDDGLNLSVALRARNLNPNIRLVLRQFVVTLGAKIEQILPDCSTLSLAAHSAATYAAAALDTGCFLALRFPESGPLVGFVQHGARDLGISGLTVGQAEERLGMRIAALRASTEVPTGALVGRDDDVVTFGVIREFRKPEPRSETRAPQEAIQKQPFNNTPLTPRLIAAFHRTNPIVRTVTLSAILFFSLSYCFFHFVLGKTLTASAFYVVETMTNVGFGEVQVTKRGPLITSGAILAMLGGIVFTSIFIGSVASIITRAQWMATQGLRRIRARNHVVICGGGKIGTAVLNLLTSVGKRVIVIEPYPDPDLVRRARERDVDLLTGDASQAGALDMCDIEHAQAVLALTNSDTTNLEIALGAHVRAPDVTLVVRMENASFARATSKLFEISTFSPADLTAPVFADISQRAGTRARVNLAGTNFRLEQRTPAELETRPPGDDWIVLCAWRGNELTMTREIVRGEDVHSILFAAPL